METLFALVLTSCLLSDTNNMVCEEFQVELSTTHSLCLEKKKENTPFLLEFDTLDCIPVTYEKE